MRSSARKPNSSRSEQTMSDVPEGERSDPEGHDDPRAHGEFRAQVHARRADLERQLEASRAQFDQAQERINARTGRNLLLAVIIGIAFGATLLLSLLVVKELFMAFAVVLAAFASYELTVALRHGGYLVPRIPTIVSAVVAVPIAYYGGAAGQLLAVLCGTLLVVGWRLAEQASAAVRGRSGGLVRDLAAAVFVQGYVVFLATFTVVLTSAEGGQWWTLAF